VKDGILDFIQFDGFDNGLDFFSFFPLVVIFMEIVNKTSFWEPGS